MYIFCCKSSSCSMTVYDNTNYGGRSLFISQQNADLRNDYFNDKISSLRITGTCDWLLYTDTNFGGTSYLVSPGNYPHYSNWGGSNDKLSSIRALAPAGTTAIMLFQHTLYRGRMLTLYSSESDFPSRGFNDQLSSFIITGGTWGLYQHTNFGGSSSSFGPGKHPNLPSGVPNDYVSSARLL